MTFNIQIVSFKTGNTYLRLGTYILYNEHVFDHYYFMKGIEL